MTPPVHSWHHTSEPVAVPARDGSHEVAEPGGALRVACGAVKKGRWGNNGLDLCKRAGEGTAVLTKMARPSASPKSNQGWSRGKGSTIAQPSALPTDPVQQVSV